MGSTCLMDRIYSLKIVFYLQGVDMFLLGKAEFEYYWLGNNTPLDKSAEQKIHLSHHMMI
jgi:hypothetical protein